MDQQIHASSASYEGRKMAKTDTITINTQKKPIIATVIAGLLWAYLSFCAITKITSSVFTIIGSVAYILIIGLICTLAVLPRWYNYLGRTYPQKLILTRSKTLALLLMAVWAMSASPYRGYKDFFICGISYSMVIMLGFAIYLSVKKEKRGWQILAYSSVFLLYAIGALLAKMWS